MEIEIAPEFYPTDFALGRLPSGCDRRYCQHCQAGVGCAHRGPEVPHLLAVRAVRGGCTTADAAFGEHGDCPLGEATRDERQPDVAGACVRRTYLCWLRVGRGWWRRSSEGRAASSFDGSGLSPSTVVGAGSTRTEAGRRGRTRAGVVLSRCALRSVENHQLGLTGIIRATAVRKLAADS